MKRLLLYRHAKAEKTQENMADFLREITDEGERQARSIGQQLVKKEWIPQLILSSDAVRAVQTAEVTTEEAGLDWNIREQEQLYGADAADYISLVRELNDDYETVMVVGHNPAVEDLLSKIVKREVDMKTAWVAVLDLDIDSWEQFANGAEVTIRETLTPSS
ncbi:MAG: SixA phosphatase family protein [Spirochaetota bacterium]